ncbi:MAG: bifunctional DNA-formamidopyrimidine glycosylase/DNA-(apurinic or apyrimidinic site) lyase [Phycisphaerales bacterium]
MPELAEVETLRRALAPVLIGRKVERVVVRTRSIVAAPGDPLAGFSRTRTRVRPRPLRRAMLLEGCAIRRLERHGKQLAVDTGDGPAICVQLGMTGGLSIAEASRPHEHVIWLLEGGVRLAFSDARRFGLIGCHTSFEDLRERRWASLGPDALTIRAEQLARACAGSGRPIKALLLDQSALAGVGNIYADESLFLAGINPTIPADRLSPERLRTLAGAIRRVLRDAIRAGGSSIRDFRTIDEAPGRYQSLHRVYARAGQPCVRCGSTLESRMIAQRRTVFCRTCQRPTIEAV